jgi:hypothetical protein
MIPVEETPPKWATDMTMKKRKLIFKELLQLSNITGETTQI